MMQSIDITNAIAFVTENGTILEKARLLRILMDVEPGRESYQKLVDSQNPDGGFPSRPKPGSRSAVDSTLTALWQFDELGMLGCASAGQALQFLLAAQQPDGGWDENPNLPQHDLPPWIVRGETGTRLYLSTYAAYWLANTGLRDTPAFARALPFLAGHQEPSGKMPGYMHSSWLGTSVFLMAGDGYAQKAELGMAYLSALPFSEWDDSQIAWALDCLTHAGLPADHAWIAAALEELAQRQAPEGSWSSEDGPAFAASATVSAIKMLKHYGWIEDIL